MDKKLHETIKYFEKRLINHFDIYGVELDIKKEKKRNTDSFSNKSYGFESSLKVNSSGIILFEITCRYLVDKKITINLSNREKKDINDKIDHETLDILLNATLDILK